MWNHQKLLILFFCIATVCVQSIIAVLTPFERKYIKDVKKQLENAKVPDGRIDYFRHWRSWENTSEDFKLFVLEKNKQVNRAANSQMMCNFNRIAYEALDVAAKLCVESFKTKLGGSNKYIEFLQNILDSGRFLHFQAFFTKNHPGGLMEFNFSVLDDYAGVCNKEFNSFQIASREQMKEFAELKSILEDAAAPRRRINHFRHWRSWDKTTDQFKLDVLKSYRNQYNNHAHLIQNQILSVVETQKKCAYEALDAAAKLSMENFKAKLAEDQDSKITLESIFNEGRFLHFEAFFGENFNETNQYFTAGQIEAEFYKNALTQYLQVVSGLWEATFEENFKKILKGKKLMETFDRLLNDGKFADFYTFLTTHYLQNDGQQQRIMPYERGMLETYLSHFPLEE